MTYYSSIVPKSRFDKTIFPLQVGLLSAVEVISAGTKARTGDGALVEVSFTASLSHFVTLASEMNALHIK